MSEDFIFRGNLKEVDPAIHDLIQREADRQARTIVLIASESESPDAIHQAIASPFAHVYAEGYPRESSRKQAEDDIIDFDYELAHYRRYSDPRYYKGVEYADMLEALTRRRAAELFAANGVSADNLYVNVQPLSGAPANNAVYTALLKPGDTLMGLKLSHGGHLSHGAPVNRTGQIFKSVSYTVDKKSEELDYDAIEAQVLKVKPNIIVCGFSAYPLVVNWQRFREMADKVGAYLLADIAHISGLVAAGVHPSPIGIADVVSTTTHKSLCGPRGAMIMTHRKALAAKIDRAVFPGEQGGPHLNTMAALAVALKLAGTDKFRELQQRIVNNAKRFAEKLTEHGFVIPFGRSENHLLMIDCSAVKGPDGTPFKGDMAARILDVAGIVINMNTILGDTSAFNPSGLRVGMVWPSQRGFGDAEIDKLADAFAAIFQNVTPYHYRTGYLASKRYRAKVKAAGLQEARRLVNELTGYVSLPMKPDSDTVVVRGDKAVRFVDAAVAANIIKLANSEATTAHVYGHDIDTDVIVEVGNKSVLLHCEDAETAAKVAQWFSDLSDGYVDFGSLYGRLAGPVVVNVISAETPQATVDNPIADTKPFFVGQENHTSDQTLPEFSFEPAEQDSLKRTALYETHKQLGAKLVDFGGYEMPVWYSSVSEEHAAVREAAGLFDVSHMGVFEVSGTGSAEFLNIVTTNNVYALSPGNSQYTYLCDPNGRIIDDLLIYQLAAEQYMLVVNASNNAEDWAWLNAVNKGEVRISNERPHAKIQNPVTLRDLRDPSSGDDQRVDIALQGKASKKILLELTDEMGQWAIKSLKWGQLAQVQLGDFDVIVSRTGYTGERTAYELFVHPDQLIQLWNKLLELGEPHGLKPAGLAARDSTRTEAGLPLHGHELQGELGLNPFEAGFSTFVKTDKPFFIGHNALINSMTNLDRVVARFRMDEKGVRRPEYGDPIIDKRGKVIGTVTSCAIDSDGYLLGLAVVPMNMRRIGTTLTLYQTGGGKREVKGTKTRLPVPNTASVISRFPKR